MSRDEELRIRTTRYVVMMMIRALLVVVCGVLVMVEAPMLWLWVPLGLLGMALLPWLAVSLANDRLTKGRRGSFTRRRGPTESTPGLETAPESRSEPGHRKIDSE